MSRDRRSWRSRCTVGLGIVLASSCFVSAVHSQASEPEKRLSDLGLPNLSGDVWVLYSEGHADRAARLQKRVEAAHRFLQRPEILGVELNMGLAVLGPEDWARWTQMPYGLAHIELGESPAVIVAATKDNWLVNSLLEGKERASEETLRLLEELGFSYEEAATTYADLVALHEMGHIYSNAYDVWPSQKWLSEFTATYLAYAHIQHSEPRLALLWDTMSSSFVETNEHAHTTLADFEELYTRVGGSNYGWYQGRFAQKVSAVFARSGISFMHELRESLATNSEAGEGDPFRLRELDAISEGFSTWAKGPDGDLK